IRQPSGGEERIGTIGAAGSRKLTRGVIGDVVAVVGDRRRPGPRAVSARRARGQDGVSYGGGVRVVDVGAGGRSVVSREGAVGDGHRGVVVDAASSGRGV